MEYKLVIRLNPIPASRPRVTRFATYYKEPYRSFKEVLKSRLIDELGSLKSPVFDSSKSLKLNIVFYMKIPKSLSKKKQELLNNTYVTTKPDLDNLTKSVLDGMNKVWFYDDSQIVVCSQQKIYSYEPRIEITIEDL